MLLCNHDILIGKSPLCIEQDVDVESPVLIESSSPKLNGVICGATVIMNNKKLKMIFFLRVNYRSKAKYTGTICS